MGFFTRDEIHRQNSYVLDQCHERLREGEKRHWDRVREAKKSEEDAEFRQLFGLPSR